MTSYTLIKHNHKNKESEIVESFSSKYECLAFMQEQAEEFIKKHEGNKTIHIYNKNSTNRVYGYFLQKSLKNINKITIKKKYKVYGYLWNSVFVDSILSFMIVEKKRNRDIHYVYNYDYIDDSAYYLCVNECIEKVINNENHRLKKLTQL